MEDPNGLGDGEIKTAAQGNQSFLSSHFGRFQIIFDKLLAEEKKLLSLFDGHTIMGKKASGISKFFF